MVLTAVSSLVIVDVSDVGCGVLILVQAVTTTLIKSKGINNFLVVRLYIIHGKKKVKFDCLEYSDSRKNVKMIFSIL